MGTVAIRAPLIDALKAFHFASDGQQVSPGRQRHRPSAGSHDDADVTSGRPKVSTVTHNENLMTGYKILASM